MYCKIEKTTEFIGFRKIHGITMPIYKNLKTGEEQVCQLMLTKFHNKKTKETTYGFNSAGNWWYNVNDEALKDLVESNQKISSEMEIE